MICVINKTLLYLMKKGKSLEEIKNLVRERYNINVEVSVLRKRLKNLKLEYPG